MPRRRAGKGRLKGWHQSAKASVVRMWDVNVRRRTAAATATDGQVRPPLRFALRQDAATAKPLAIARSELTRERRRMKEHAWK